MEEFKHIIQNATDRDLTLAANLLFAGIGAQLEQGYISKEEAQAQASAVRQAIKARREAV